MQMVIPIYLCLASQALKQVGGALRQQYEGWREELKVCLAHTEAVIDFGDVRYT